MIIHQVPIYSRNLHFSQFVVYKLRMPTRAKLKTKKKKIFFFSNKREFLTTNENISRPNENFSRTNENISRTNENFSRTDETISRTNEIFFSNEREHFSSEREFFSTKREYFSYERDFFSNERRNISRPNENISRPNENISRPNENFSRTNEKISRTNENFCRTNENISRRSEFLSRKKNYNLTPSTKKDRPTRKTATFWHNVGRWSHDNRPICPFSEMWLGFYTGGNCGSWAAVSPSSSGRKTADIRRLSAYDRSIKGHRPNNLTIVARLSPDARPSCGVLWVPLWSRPKVGRLSDRIGRQSLNSVPITKSQEIGERRHKIITWHHRQKKVGRRKKTAKIVHNVHCPLAVDRYALFWPHWRPPLVGLGNVTGVYRRHFILPIYWRGQHLGF